LAILAVSSTNFSMAFLEMSDVEADAELCPKKSRNPRRFSPAWLIFSTSLMRTVTKNDSLSAMTTSPWEAPLAFAIDKISWPNSGLNSSRSINHPVNGSKRLDVSGKKRLERFELFERLEPIFFKPSSRPL
jgi:hypothetical protein